MYKTTQINAHLGATSIPILSLKMSIWHFRWVGAQIYIYHDVFCDKMVPEKIPFQKKKYYKQKWKITTYAHFFFHFVLVLVLEGFLNFSFLISSWKEAPTSNIYSSHHVENGRGSNYVIGVYSFRNIILTSRDGLASNDWSTVVLLFFVLDHTSSFGIIHTGIDNRQFVWYFLCTIRDIIMHNAHAIKVSSNLKLFRSCPLIKIVHTYQNFLEQN